MFPLSAIFSRKSSNSNKRQAFRRRALPRLEAFEDRVLLSITWVNKGSLSSDSDGLNAVFGSNATLARNVVQAAIDGWANVITNFNYSNGTNNFKLTVNMGSPGLGAEAYFASQVDANHKPMAGTISLGSGGNGHGQGWFLDPTPYDSSEFQGTIINAYAANATPGGPADGLSD